MRIHDLKDLLSNSFNPSSFLKKSYEEVEKLDIEIIRYELDPTGYVDIHALKNSLEEKKDKFLDLVLENNINWNRVFSLPSLSVDEAHRLQKLGMTSNALLKSAFSSYPDERYEQLLNLALKGTVKWDDFNVITEDIPRSISLKDAEKLLKYGMRPSSLLNTALKVDPGKKHDQLLDLALSYKMDWDHFYCSYSLSFSDAEKLLKHGLKSTDPILSSALKLKSSEERTKLIDLTFKGNYNLKYVGPLPEDISVIEARKLLDHGLEPAKLLFHALFIDPKEERREDLIDISLQKRINWEDLVLLPRTTTQHDLEKLLNHGFHPNTALDMLLKGGMQKEHNYNLVKLLIEKGADISSIKALGYNVEQSEYLLDFKVKANFLLEEFLNKRKITYDLTDQIYNSASLTEEQKIFLDRLLKNGGDINKVFTKFTQTVDEVYRDGKIVPYMIPKNILNSLVQDFSLKISLAHKYLLDNGLSTSMNDNDASIEKSSEDIIFSDSTIETKEINSKENTVPDNQKKILSAQEQGYWYSVKYPNTNLEKDKFQIFPSKAKVSSDFVSHEGSLEFAKNKLFELKESFHKVTDGVRSKLVNNDNGRSIECEDSCNIIIYEDIQNNCSQNFNGNYCWLNSDGSIGGGWISREITDVIKWDFN